MQYRLSKHQSATKFVSDFSFIKNGKFGVSGKRGAGVGVPGSQSLWKTRGLSFISKDRENYLAPVVQKLDSAIHRINLYPLDNAIGFPDTYPLDSDLSGG